jgi:hypothetical protein
MLLSLNLFCCWIVSHLDQDDRHTDEIPLFTEQNIKECWCLQCSSRVKVMVFNATFNNISVLLVEETRVPGENQRHVTNH